MQILPAVPACSSADSSTLLAKFCSLCCLHTHYEPIIRAKLFKKKEEFEQKNL